MGTYLDLFVDQGSDFFAFATMANTDGIPLNISTGYTFTGQAKMSRFTNNANAVVNISCTIANGALGNVMISLNAATTGSMRAGEWYYDVLVNNSVYVSRLIEGKIYLSPGVTNVTPPDEGIPAL